MPMGFRKPHFNKPALKFMLNINYIILFLFSDTILTTLIYSMIVLSWTLGPSPLFIYRSCSSNGFTLESRPVWKLISWNSSKSKMQLPQVLVHLNHLTLPIKATLILINLQVLLFCQLCSQTLLPLKLAQFQQTQTKRFKQS